MIHFTALQFVPVRPSAVEFGPMWVGSGRFGSVVSPSVRLGLDRILIIEDDCVFLPEIDANWSFNPPPGAKMIYFGGLFWKQQPEPSIQTGNQPFMVNTVRRGDAVTTLDSKSVI